MCKQLLTGIVCPLAVISIPSTGSSSPRKSVRYSLVQFYPVISLCMRAFSLSLSLYIYIFFYIENLLESIRPFRFNSLRQVNPTQRRIHIYIIFKKNTHVPSFKTVFDTHAGKFQRHCPLLQSFRLRVLWRPYYVGLHSAMVSELFLTIQINTFKINTKKVINKINKPINQYINQSIN